MDNEEASPASLAFEREKWEREQSRLEREFSLKERELTFKEQEARRARWWNPLVIAILAAAIAALGNAYVSWQNNQANQVTTIENGKSNFDLETFKAESARMLEVVKTGDPNKAAENLQFLLDTGLVRDTATVASIKNYLTQRKKGEGVSLPVPSGQQGPFSNFSGADLTGANLAGADLKGSDLTDTNLSEANLKGANLSIARLKGAQLTGANLDGASLEKAGLMYADLTRANLTKADLKDANLDYARMQDVMGLTQTQLDAACGTHALLPPGLTLRRC